jgi:tRNA 2-thiouridine synthesizing protein D
MSDLDDRKTLTFAIMDAPYEQARSTTALRLIDLAARRGYDIKVFAYEGAVALSSPQQRAHANSIHGRDVDQEDHPLPHRWIAALQEEARANGGHIDWVNCGLCVDERGADEAIEGVRRGTPADFWGFVQESDNTLVIPTR